MYKIQYVFKLQDQIVKKYKKTEITLEEIRNNTVLNTVYFISVKDSTISYYADNIGINLSLLLMETIFNICTDWNMVEALLTERYVLAYKEAVPGYNANGGYRNALISYYVNQYLETKTESDVTTTYKWKVDYFDYREWSKRSIAMFKAMMPDLLLEGPTVVNHKNCIVVCNGHALYTEYVAATTDHGEQLLVKQGARHLWSTTKNYQPDIICLDFSSLGNISKYPMSSFKQYNTDYDGKKDIRFVFDGIDLSKYTPVLVIAGSMIFPHQLDKHSNTIRFNPRKCNISAMLSKKAFDQYKYLYGIPMYEADVSANTYVTTTMWSEECRDAFMILIENSRVYVETHFDYQFANPYLSVDKTQITGIVKHRTTGALLGYIDSKYYNEHFMYLNRNPRLWMVTELPSDIPIVSTSWTCKHTNRPYMDNYTGCDDDCITTLHNSTLDVIQLLS